MAVAAYLICIPLAGVATDRIGGHDLARIAQVVLGLFCAWVVLRRFKAGVMRVPPAHLAVIALFACLAVAATLRAAIPSMAARELALLAGMMGMALVAAGMRDAIEEPARVASVASAAYVAVILMLVVAGYLAGQPLNRSEIFVGYDNYRFFNHVQTAALPLSVLAATVAPPRSWHRVVAWFAATGGFALLFAVMGRGTLVGVFIGALAVAAMFGAQALPTLRNLGAAAGGGLLAYGALFWLLPLLLGAPRGLVDGYYEARVGSIEMRLYLWRIALSYIEQSPWLGIGPMHYAHHPTGDAAHPHNIYLQIAAEWGIPMLVALLWLFAWLIRRLAVAVRGCADPRERNCGIGLVLAGVAIAVDGLFSGNFVMPVSQVWIAFAVGWALAWLGAQERVEAPCPAPMSPFWNASRLVAVALLMSQLWLVASIWPEARNLDAVIQQTTDRFPAAAMNPRFWSHGWF
jgi:O-antigen ligase